MARKASNVNVVTPPASSKRSLLQNAREEEVPQPLAPPPRPVLPESELGVAQLGRTQLVNPDTSLALILP